jgi:hypothetical protein
MSSRAVLAAAVYAGAKEFAQAHFSAELIWQSSISIDDITESSFLREAAWVIFCTGFRERTLRARFDYLSLCFCDWESGEMIVKHAAACRTSALASFNNTRKVDSLIQIASRVAGGGFSELKRDILCQPIDALKALPYIGPVTAYHLAKNLGLPVAKPDRHLQRLAVSLCYPDAHALCREIAAITGDPPQVVDLVFWRYLSETSRLRQAHLPAGCPPQDPMPNFGIMLGD